MEHESEGDNNCNRCARIGTGTGGLGHKRTSRDHLNYSIVEISQDTEKSLGKMRRFALTQTPVSSHRLIMVWKLSKINDNNNDCSSSNSSIKVFYSWVMIECSESPELDKTQPFLVYWNAYKIIGDLKRFESIYPKQNASENVLTSHSSTDFFI